MSSWTTCGPDTMPPEERCCLVQLENHDIVVAFRCSAWETGFFTSRALKQKGKSGSPMRKLEKLHARAVRWRDFGELPESVRPMIVSELAWSRAREIR